LIVFHTRTAFDSRLYAAPNFVVVDVAQYENRFDDPAERRQCFSDSIRWRGAAQALEHYMGGHHAITETRRQNLYREIQMPKVDALECVLEQILR